MTTIHIPSYWVNKTGGAITEQMSNGPTQDIWSFGGGNIQKGNTVEMWDIREDGIYQIADSSPLNDSEGRVRYYVINGGKGSLWIPNTMTVGQTFTGPIHNVQFKNVINCEDLSENSGQATATVTLKSVGPMTFNKYDQNISFNRVATIIGNGETHFFAEGLGRVGWEFEGLYSEVVEIHGPGQRVSPETNLPPCFGQ